jgi:phage/plasmid-like protein (TIGR03299 family)
MAHELAFVNGKAQVFVVGDPAWHQLGDRLDRAPSYQEAMTKYGLDYPLEKLPYSRPCATSPTGWQEAGDAFYVQRKDTGAVLGSVRSVYEIVTNAEAFAPLEPLVDSGLLTLETGGVLREGADAWLLGRWAFDRMGDTAKEVFGDEVIPFSAIMSNHSGRRGILLGNTPIRVVCANTLGAAEESGISKWVSVAHTSQAKSNLIAAAEEIFAGVIRKYETIAKAYKLLKATALTAEQFNLFVLDAIAPDPRLDPKYNPEAKLAEVVLNRALNKREKITDLWATGKGHTGEQNAWYAYNAAVEAIDHHSDLWARRDGSWQSRGLLGGTYQKMKDAVLNNLISYAMGV